MGRQRKYTPEAMEAKIEKYFDTQGVMLSDNKMMPRLWSLMELNRYLGITRETWSKYIHDEKYTDILKKAKDRIGEAIFTLGACGLIDKTMAIFYLKSHHDWSEDGKRDETERHDALAGVIASLERAAEKHK